MIKCRSQVIGAAARALVHAHNIHAGGQSLLCHAQHVVRFRRSFKSVHHYYGKRSLAIDLPMTMAKHVNPRLNFDQAFFRFW